MTQIQQQSTAAAADATATTPASASRPQPVNVLDRVGMGILALLSLTGLWVILAPFVVDGQGRGADWTSGTVNDVVVGIVLAVLPLAALIVLIGGALREIARTAHHRAAHVQG